MKFKKLFSVFLISIFCFMYFSNTALAANEYSWYIKRNGNNQPEIQKEQEMIYKYEGYFLDKKICDNSEKRVIYLTFDMGYINDSAEQIILTLDKENVKAAFFILDNIILRNKEIVTKLSDNGHLICNHTKNHKNLASAEREEIIKDLTELEILYKEKTGKEISKFFRFPEGRYSENALKCVNELGYKTIFWSFAYDDWDNSSQPPPEKAIRKILSNTHNGAVFLFHPTSKTNAEIFPKLIESWRNMGYKFGTLDELVG